MVDELPSGDTGDMVPVVLPTIEVGMVPNTAPGIIVVDDIVVDGVIVAVLPAMDVETVLGTVDGVGTDVAVTAGGGAAVADDDTGIVESGKSVINDVAGVADSENGAVVDMEEVPGTADIVDAADIDGIDPVVPPTADMDVTGTAGVPGAICPVGVEQVTTVPGVVGSEANGTGASVVPGVPGWVVAENGLGPLSGDVTIVPGVDGSPIAVLPMVETCARPASQPASKMAVVNSRCRIAILSSTPI